MTWERIAEAMWCSSVGTAWFLIGWIVVLGAAATSERWKL